MIRILYNPQTPPNITTEHSARRVVAIVAILIVSGVALAPQLLSRPLAWILQAFRG